MELLVLSDDFTGALDTGVQFARQGVHTVVTSKLNLTAEDLGFTNVTVLVINTESRHVSNQEAYRKVKKAVRNLLRLAESGLMNEVSGEGGTRRISFYKKTDSLLRGNVGIELKALREAVSSPHLMFVPAFPKTGRTTRGGIQFVGGIPIHKSSFARDRLNPIPESDVSVIVKRGSPLVRTVTVGTEQIQSRSVSFTERANGEPGKEAGTVYIFDAVTDDHLKDAGQVLKERGLLRVTAGCAGFAGVLPELLELPRRILVKPILKAPLLVLCGSLTDLSRKQVEYAARKGFAKKALGIEEKLLPDLSSTDLGRAIVSDVVNRLNRGQHCIIATAEANRKREQAFAKSNEIDRNKIPSHIATNLAGLVHTILKRIPLSTLVIFGGDTTMALLKTLGIEFLTPLEEIAPGVPVSVSSERNLCLVTKSGGFGGEDVLIRIMSRLQKQD
jgi:uncharacterized protein YgbK (DUF1537 family)